MLVAEELPRYLGTDSRPIGRGDRIVSQLAGLDLERLAQPDRCLNVCVGQLGGVQLLQPLACEGVQPGAKERFHLLRRHRIPSAEAIDPDQTGADPRPRTLSAFGVVGGQTDTALPSGVQRIYLPRQIVVPRPSAELVNAHRHAPRRAMPSLWRSARSGYVPVMQEVCPT